MNLSALEQDAKLLEFAIEADFGAYDVVQAGRSIEDPKSRLEFLVDSYAILEERKARSEVEKEPPVSARTFFTEPYFMGGVVRLWPKLLDEICEACSGKYTEAVFTGGIGVGKSTAALCVLAYYTYRVMNLRDPHSAFDIDPNSEIAFVMQSITGKTAYTVDYMRFRRMLEASPWFRANAPHDPEKTSVIAFRKHPILVQPLSGHAEAAIGENVFGGMIDEVNHMKVVQQSSKKRGGEVYDQMLENYRAIARRRESRFQRMGRVPGMLCLCGSANYAGQFTDRKREERDAQLERDGETTIYFFDKRAWEVQPDDRFSPKRFEVFLGDGSRRPRVIKPGEALHPNDAPYIMKVPEDFRNAFESDCAGAIKDVAGIALHGFANFISNFQAIAKAFGTRENIFDPDWCDFDIQGASIRQHSIPDQKMPRYVHIDLSLSMDYAALSMAHCPGFKKVDRGGGMVDILPRIAFDGCLSIRPPGGSQIPIHKIKKLVFALREFGYPIQWVSLDGFQSADFIQTMRRSGIKSGIVSLDKKPDPYMLTRQLILDGLVEGPDNELARKELRELVWVSQNTKVDHPADGSKDIADTIAGCCYGLATKRAIWVAWGENPAKASFVTKQEGETA